MGRSPCCDEFGLKKGPWTTEEDEKLIDYVSKHGHRSWRALPKLAGLNRCGKSCRLRWTNYLRPDIKRGKFTEEEERYIIELHSRLGNKWSAIAANLPGRTDNEIKNYWNTHIRKKLLRMGIDPVTHRPRADLSLLANLPQFFAGNSSVAVLEGGLRPQVDAAQLARLQLAQTLVQVLTGYGSSSVAPLPTMDATNLMMGSGFLQNQIDSLGLSQRPTQNLPPSLCSLEQNMTGDGLMVPSFNDAFGFESATPTTNSTPSMPSASSESIVVDQVKDLPNPTNINNDPSTANYNEPWEGLEDLCGDLYWKNILDQLTLPTCYNT